MRFKVLGSLEVEHDGTILTPRAAKQRQVLALLLLNVNRSVRMSELVRELWGADPPASAVNTLQTYILRIRRIIDAERADGSRDHGKNRLVSVPPSYVLRLAEEQLDLSRFERLVRHGTAEIERGDLLRAAELLHAAGELCRGPALGDVVTGPLLTAHARRLEEQIRLTREQRIDVDLLLGRHRTLIGELSHLTDVHRTHERLHGQLMIALYQSGRQVEALDVYQQLRRRFVAELGLEPTAWLTELHQTILVNRLDVSATLLPAAAGSRGLAVTSRAAV